VSVLTGPEIDRVGWAWKGATAVGRRVRRDRRELLGAAWQSVSRLPAGSDPALCFRAAYCGALDAVRVAAGWRVQGRTRVVDCGDEAAALAELADRPDHGSPEARLLALWCDYRADRLGADIRARLWAYLLRVEGWTIAEVAAVWGCHPNFIHKLVSAAGFVVRRKDQLTRSLPDGRDD